MKYFIENQDLEPFECLKFPLLKIRQPIPKLELLGPFGYAMPIWASNPDDLWKETCAKCDEIYALVLASARPVLQHGTEQEVPGWKGHTN